MVDDVGQEGQVTKDNYCIFLNTTQGRLLEILGLGERNL
jgi:hypothetical protein